MLILLLVIFIGLIVVGSVLDNQWSFSDAGLGLTILGSICGVFVFIAMLVVGILFSCTNTIPNKIVALEEQNQKIETQINSIAEDYLTHEGDTYDKLTPDNTELFAVSYPQLSSNETVRKQMDVYIENNNKITKLKLELCDRNVYAWWLYFGGGK